MVGSGSRRVVEGYWMKLPLVGIAVALAFAGSDADAKLPPLRDPVFLNIGFVCQWQDSCIEKQPQLRMPAHQWPTLALSRNGNPTKQGRSRGKRDGIESALTISSFARYGRSGSRRVVEGH